jgi:hypothetical protein
LLFQLHLHNSAGLVGTPVGGHEMAARNIGLAAHDLPDCIDGVDNRRTRRVGHEGGKRKGVSSTMVEFKISLVRAIILETGQIRAEGKVLNCGQRVCRLASSRRF